MKLKLGLAAVAAAGVLGATSFASAAVIEIDISGTSLEGGWATPGNPNWTFTIGAGSTIKEVEFIDVEIFAGGSAWASDFTMSVNDSDISNYWDASLPGAPGAGGAYGPVSGLFSTSPTIGGPFTLNTDDLYVELYGWADIDVISGTLRITYNPIPAPGALALLGVAGLAGASRRRRA